MNKHYGVPDGGIVVAIYTRSPHTWTCRKIDGYYTATFNVRKTNVTYYSQDKEEINDLIREELKKGFKRIF